jgi:hypothetical protein
VGDLLQNLLAPVFRWLPKNVQTRIRFSIRSARRWTRYKGTFALSKVNPVRIHLAQRSHKAKGSDEVLVRMLHVKLDRRYRYDELQMIAAQVHYVDLVNLSLVSKRVRSVMFPSLEDSTEDRQLRYHSCKGPNEKTTCWTCGVQVCLVSRALNILSNLLMLTL